MTTTADSHILPYDEAYRLVPSDKYGRNCAEWEALNEDWRAGRPLPLNVERQLKPIPYPWGTYANWKRYHPIAARTHVPQPKARSKKNRLVC